MSRRFFLALSWTRSSWRGIKNLFRWRQRESKKPCEHGAENGKQKFNQTRRRSDNRSTRVDCHIYRRNKYFQRRHVLWKHEKEYCTSVRRLQSWYLEKYKAELHLTAFLQQKLRNFEFWSIFLFKYDKQEKNKGKEYEPGSLQTYRNGLRIYFHQLAVECSSAVKFYKWKHQSFWI